MAPSYPVDNVTRGFRRTDRDELDTFFFAAALAFDLCFFALFMSFGAVVRSCLICVGASCGVPWVSEGQSQGALTVGMDSRMSRIVSDKGEPYCAIEEGISNRTSQLQLWFHTRNATTAALRTPRIWEIVGSEPFGSGTNLIGCVTFLGELHPATRYGI